MHNNILMNNIKFNNNKSNNIQINKNKIYINLIKFIKLYSIHKLVTKDIQVRENLVIHRIINGAISN